MENREIAGQDQKSRRLGDRRHGWELNQVTIVDFEIRHEFPGYILECWLVQTLS
jgi:hypothetical protein